MKRLIGMLCICTTGSFAAFGQLIAPSFVDEDTLHLWHLDDVSMPVFDSASAKLPMQGLLGGAILGRTSMTNFGSALDTDAGGSDGGILLAAGNLDNGSGDDVPFTHADPATGAFTYEAIIKFDDGYDPRAQPSGDPKLMQIISMDNDGSIDRVFQWRYEGRTSVSSPKLNLINITYGAVQGISAVVPLTGSNAVNNTDWFHVAVTYTGEEGVADNLKLYWTRLGAAPTNANLLGTGTMNNDLPTVPADFAIGNEGRATYGSSNGFPGRIDEVRISSVARAADVMIPAIEDSDHDGMADAWEQYYFTNLFQTATNDLDLDGFDNQTEYLNGTDPTVFNDSDSDNDGLPDDWELEQFGNLVHAGSDDYDHDGESNLEEYSNNTDPVNPNSVAVDIDGDSLPDAWELDWFDDILDSTAYDDPDLDGYNNVAERAAGTDPQDDTSHPAWRSPRVAFLRDTLLATNALLMGSSAGYGRQINGVSFQCEILMTFDGYQYSAWYDTSNTVEMIWLARRAVDGVGAGPWEVFKTDSEFIRGDENVWDAHNVVSLGIAPDGTLHMAWDHHVHTLRYRSSVPGLCTTNKAAWGAGMLNPEQDYLVPGKTIAGLTYPMFFNKPTGELFFTYRVGGSTGGDHYLHEYDDGTGTWSDRWMVTSKSGTYTGLLYNGYGTSTSRNPYENGWDFGPDGTLHHTWTCREQADDANHDIHYAYSEDGIVWRNTFGDIIADTSLGQTVTVNSPGIVVKVLNSRQQLINQQHQCVDNDGRVHVLMYHRRAEPGYEWQSGDGKFGGPDTAYYHYFRDPVTGEWAQRRLPVDSVTVGSRPKIGFDKKGNVYAIFVNAFFLGSGGNGRLVVASASMESQYTDWAVVNEVDIDFTDCEPLMDQARLLADNILSVYVQENGLSLSVASQTPLHVIDFAVDVPEPASPSTIAYTCLGDDVLISTYGQAGISYRMQTSIDLTDSNEWNNVGSLISGMDSLIAFPDVTGLQNTQKFYRVMSTAVP